MLILIVWEFIKFSEPILNPCPPMADIALIETQIFFAKEWKEFTGVYSRFQFNHPGPIQFYWNAWMEWMTPITVNSLGKHQFSTWLLNKLFLLFAFSFFLHSIQFVKTGWFYGLVFLFLYVSLFFRVNYDLNYTIWNPANTIAPIFVFLFSYPYLKKGNILALVLLPIITQFAFQNHIGVAILIAPMTIYAFYRIYQDRPIPREKLILYLGYYITLSLILFSPAIYQEITDEKGNITKLIDFFSHSGGIKKNLWKTLCFIGSIYTGSYSNQSELVRNLSGFLYLIILIVIGSTRYIEGVWQEWKNIFWFAFGCTLYASLGMKGPFIEFGIWFYYAIAFLSILLLIKSLEDKFSIFWKQFINKNQGYKINLILFHTIILAILLTISPQNFFFRNKVSCNETERSEIVEVLNYFKKLNTRVQFYLPFNEEHGDQWPTLAGVVNVLNAEGLEICVNGEWNFMFQKNLHCDRWNGLEMNKLQLVEVRNQKNYLSGGGILEDWKWNGKVGNMLLLAKD